MHTSTTSTAARKPRSISRCVNDGRLTVRTLPTKKNTSFKKPPSNELAANLQNTNVVWCTF